MDFVVVKDRQTDLIEVQSKGPKGDPGPTPDLSPYQLRSEKGQVNGYAGLGGTSKVPVAQLPVGTTAGTVAAGDDARLNRYRLIFRGANRLIASVITGAGDYPAGSGGTTQAATTAGHAALLVYLDPANGATLRMAAACGVNDTPPGRTLIWGLYATGSPSGAVNVYNPNLGAVIPASTITFTTPAANSKSTETVTADFSCPAAGWHCLGANASGAFTANSIAMIAFRLEQKD